MPSSPPAPAPARAYVDHPEGWRVVETRGPAGFVTRVVYEDQAGARYEWTSRRHRKGLGLRQIDGPAGLPPAVIPARLLNRWIGALFMIGAFCFAIGSLPGFAARVPDPTLVGVTFFVGSVFFTSAAGLQHIQTVRADRAVGGADRGDRRPTVGYLIEPGRLDWWATAVQFVGTLFFNVTTFAALNETLDTQEQIARVWAPDAFGSVCFLVASYFAVIEVCHGRWCWWRRDTGWRISALNMLGSVFFGISAIASFILPDTGEIVNAEATNLFTFLGAACFFWGAYLLLPEAASAQADEPAGATTASA